MSPKFSYFFSVFLLFAHTSIAQTTVADQFLDSNTSKQLWQGDFDKFQFVSGGLMTASKTVNDTFGLVTPLQFQSMHQRTWKFQMQIGFATSSLNYVDLILLQDTAMGSALSIYARIGGTKDEIVLYRKENGKITLLADSEDGITELTYLELAVSFQSDSLRLCYRRSPQEAEMCLAAVPIILPTKKYLTGFEIRQSSASFFSKLILHQFFCGPQIPDTRKPKVSSAGLSEDGYIHLAWNEPMLAKPFPRIQFGNNALSKMSWSSPNQLQILQDTIQFGVNIPLRIQSACDVGMNCADTVIYLFNPALIPPGQFDVIFTEIMADPEPVVGCPNSEYLEILNRSNHPFNLRNWVLSDAAKSYLLPSFVLQPHSYAVICPAAFAQHFKEVQVLAIDGFPTLNNGGDTVSLHYLNGDLVHRVSYQQSQWGESWKKEGGWSLELIDTSKPCLASNWLVSADPSGGSPGKGNSVAQILTKLPTFHLEYAYPVERMSIVLRFSRGLKSGQDLQSLMNIKPGLIQWIELVTENQLMLHLSEGLEIGKKYELIISGLMDCLGQTIAETAINLAYPEPIEAGDVIINEVVFNPLSGFDDMVELMNRSHKVLNLAELYLVAMNGNGIWSDRTSLSAQAELLFPGDIIGFTPTSDLYRQHYPNGERMRLRHSNRLPSLPDQAGTIGLMLSSGMLVDSFSYREDFHFPLVPTKEGVGLERISPDLPSHSESNWTSGSYTNGYASPGYSNAAQITSKSNMDISLSSDPFSPNGDGYQDALAVHFKISSDQAIFHLRVFDLTGRMVAFPVNTALNSGQGTFLWDGTGLDGDLLLPGIYLIHLESLDMDGRRCQKRTPVTLHW